MLPPIRYPLPSLVALILTALLVWIGAELTKGWRAEMSQRLRLAVEGPPVPSSPKPQLFAGPVTRRVLLLLDQTPATARPNGSTVETIDRRMFVDVYDTWPAPGPTSHIRVGNRKPIGWVPLADVLPWDTRLVIRAADGRLELADTPDGAARSVEVGRLSFPVVAWSGEAVEIAVWDPARPWSKVARRAWVRLDSIPLGDRGIWISQVELPTLLSLATQGETPLYARLRAVMGRLADNRSWSPADLVAIQKSLPAFVFDPESSSRKSAGKLAEANSQPVDEAGWAGLAFRFLPLGDLP